MPTTRNQAHRKVLYIAFVCAIALVALRFGAYFITGSTAILSDALESFVHFFTTGFALYSVYLSSQPKDTSHPYGHGKIEFLAAGTEGAFIIIAGLVVYYQAIYTWIFPEPLINLDKGMILILASGLVNLFLGLYIIRQGKKWNSLVLEADGKHWLVDTYTSIGLLAGLGIVYVTDIYYLDKVLALGLGTWIIFSGMRLVRTSFSGLLDESDREVLERISKILTYHRKDRWIDMHNLRIQKYGNSFHVDCHLTLPWYDNLRDIHQEMVEVENLVNTSMKEQVEFFIHPDPCQPQSCPICSIKDCKVRQAPFEKKIPWNVESLIRTTMHNKKADK